MKIIHSQLFLCFIGVFLVPASTSALCGSYKACQLHLRHVACCVLFIKTAGIKRISLPLIILFHCLVFVTFCQYFFNLVACFLYRCIRPLLELSLKRAHIQMCAWFLILCGTRARPMNTRIFIFLRVDVRHNRKLGCGQCKSLVLQVFQFYHS